MRGIVKDLKGAWGGFEGRERKREDLTYQPAGMMPEPKLWKVEFMKEIPLPWESVTAK